MCLRSYSISAIFWLILELFVNDLRALSNIRAIFWLNLELFIKDLRVHFKICSLGDFCLLILGSSLSLLG
jgi:hypothetical protein